MLFFLFLSGSIARSEGEATLRPPCTVESPVGVECEVVLKALHPTQPDVGLDEVKKKIAEYQQLSTKKLEKMKAKKIIPILIGPDGNAYLVDRHHTSLALIEIDEKKAYAKVLENFSTLDADLSMEKRMKKFWEYVTRNGNEFLFREDGSIADPMGKDFPKELGQCGNNRYRSVASALIDAEVIKKPEGTYYFEFKVAEILRKMGLKVEGHSPDEWVEHAKKLLQTEEGRSALKKIGCLNLLEILSAAISKKI